MLLSFSIATPLSSTSQSTVLALIIGVIVAIVCTVFILISLGIVTCVCLKRKLSANITSSAIISPITTTSCNTTKNGNIGDNNSFPKDNDMKYVDYSIITTNDPVYESITNRMPLQTYESNIVTTKNAAYQCNVPQMT